MEFVAHPSTKRWFRDIVITEKIDGSNAAVIIKRNDETEPEWVNTLGSVGSVFYDGVLYHVGAQSRKRLLQVGKSTDNFGFASWVSENAVSLVMALGEGRHFGEWWGAGIQRGYGLTSGDRRFSLFNVAKWIQPNVRDYIDSVSVDIGGVPGLRTVPVLYQGRNSEAAIRITAKKLHMSGSHAEPGFKPPEGVAIFHVASNKIFKFTPYHGEDGHKSNG